MIIVLTPGDDSLKRSDRRNLFVLSAANVAAAKARAEELCADSAGAFEDWTATILNDSSTQDFVIECSGSPTGSKDGSVWNRLTSAGDRLAA